jgi:trehalose 6-phosphate phosphatase
MPLPLHPQKNALFLDIDGTLLDIAPTPEEAVVPESLLADLARLHARLGGALALISGRNLANIDALFSPLRLPAAGAHGAEWRPAADGLPQHAEPLPDTLRHSIKAAFSADPALRVEDKRYAVAVHYRDAPAMGGAVAATMRSLAAREDASLLVMQGKMICEVISPAFNKGAALERFLAHPPFAGRLPVFLGDDETDRFAVEASRRLGGVGVRVGEADPAYADAFSTPKAVRHWLGGQLTD